MSSATMKQQSFSNPLLYRHTCEALLLTCMDFRFHEITARFLHETLGVKTFDLLTVPGAAKAVAEQKERGKYIEETIALSHKLHGIKQVILVNHAECGAYGIENTDTELKTQGEDLKKSAQILKGRFPNLLISFFFAQKRAGMIHYIQPIRHTQGEPFSDNSKTGGNEKGWQEKIYA